MKKLLILILILLPIVSLAKKDGVPPGKPSNDNQFRISVNEGARFVMTFPDGERIGSERFEMYQEFPGLEELTLHAEYAGAIINNIPDGDYKIEFRHIYDRDFDFEIYLLNSEQEIAFSLDERMFTAEGKAKRKDLNIPDFLKSLVCALPTILAHSKFNECSSNKDRYVSHLLVFFSFLGLFVVTNCFFVALYILQLPGPYSMGNPVKILANISAVALLVGVILMIYNRLQDKGENIGKGSYFDWSLIILVLGLVATGILSEVTRIAHAPILAYPIYFMHLVFVFCLFAYLPFSKLAHLVYRTLAMAYSRYSEREPCE